VLPASSARDERTDTLFRNNPHVFDVRVFMDFREPGQLLAIFKIVAFPAAIVAALQAAFPNFAVGRASISPAQPLAPHLHHRP